jgi:hypothetical protein
MVIGFFSVNFCIVAIKKNYMQMKKGLFGIFGANFAIFAGEIIRSCHVQILHT